MKRFINKVCTLAIAVLIVVLSTCAEGSGSISIAYYATTASRLRLHRINDVNSGSINSIPEGTELKILDISGELFKVSYKNKIGYVNPEHFVDFRVKTSKIQGFNSDVKITEEKTAKANITPESFNMLEEYIPRYIAKPSDSILLYKEPNETSGILVSIPRYTSELTMSQIKSEWAMAKYNDRVGFIKTKSLVQYDFIDPYAERFPGIINYQYAAVLPADTVIYDGIKLGKSHKTIPGGAVMALEDSDIPNYMHVAYMKRRQALIKKDDILAVEKVIDYESAKKGDLISVFSTFFPVHNTNLHIMGRIYNMALAGDMLSGVVLKPGERLSMNDIMGPYKKHKGYMEAPIASKVAHYGYGGGTCQVNTTMYNALIQVPLLVKHRRVHSKSGAVYVPVGFDAAVGSLSTINMIFENTLSYPVMFKYSISDNVLTCLIYRAD